MPRVVLLTSDSPGPTSTFVVEQVVSTGLIDAIVVVRSADWRWTLRQAWRVFRRRGIRGVWDRWQARRLRARLLRDEERRFLVEDLFPDGVPAFPQIPAGLPIHRAAALGSRQTVDLVRGLDPELGVQAGAGWIRQPLLSVPRRGFLSLHHGMMPAIRGMDSILWAYVERRLDWCGITLQAIDAGLDTGRIVSQRAVIPEPGENPYGVIARATRIGVELMAQGIRDVLSGREPGIAAAAKSGEYRSALTRAAVRELAQLIRDGIAPHPSAGIGAGITPVPQSSGVHA